MFSAESADASAQFIFDIFVGRMSSVEGDDVLEESEDSLERSSILTIISKLGRFYERRG